MRIKHTVNVRVAEDSEMAELLFGKPDEAALVTVDSYTHVASGSLEVLADQTESLSLGDVSSVKGLFLRVDNDCLVNVNELGTFQLRKPSTQTGTTARLFIEGDITSVTVKAPVGSNVHGVYCVWGDVAA